MVIRGPEEGPDHAGALDGTERQAQRPHHGRILGFLQRDVVWRKGLVLLGVFLKAVSSGQPSSGTELLVLEGHALTYTRRRPLRSFASWLGGSKAPYVAAEAG